ncbi:hypothetical protein BD779DRAFT_1675716 [Infundibulicybe gibba]|nr:hypothetical protein BD779DRAFT_1675716 [Infundibulicybe gibba]
MDTGDDSETRSEYSSNIREFWDGVINSQLARVGGAPSPQVYSHATTSSTEALDEEERSLTDAMEAIRSRCYAP